MVEGDYDVIHSIIIKYTVYALGVVPGLYISELLVYIVTLCTITSLIKTLFSVG